MSDPPPAADFLVASLPELHTWPGRPDEAQLAGLPNTPAILLFVDEAGRPVQLLTTQQLKRLALVRLCAAAEPRRARADLAEIVRGVRWRPVHCPLEARWWYYRLARALHPREYRKMVSFGPAWFLHVDWGQPIPEIRVTERVWNGPGEWIGPWPARSAGQQALEGLWDLFDLCRYPEQIRRSPVGQRCAYAEMGRCDAPCDGTVPLDAYVTRCREAWEFAGGAVTPWIDAAVERMRAAASEQRYERAAQLKQQIDFARTWQTQWLGRVHAAPTLNYMLAVPVTRRRAWKLFLFRAGVLEEGPLLTQRKLGAGADTWLRERLQQAVAACAAVEKSEQTWLICHFLSGREAETAICVWLPDEKPPDDFAAEIAARAAVLRPARSAAASDDTNSDSG